MFVFLVLPILYPNGTLAGFAKATKTCLAAKCRLPVLKWTSESGYKHKSKSDHLTPRCACAARGILLYKATKYSFPKTSQNSNRSSTKPS